MRKLKRHIFTHANNIVVGGDVASLLWAFKEDAWVAFTEPLAPYWFETLETGLLKEELWSWLVFQLNLRGKILGTNPNKSIRTEGNILKIMTEENTLLNYAFDNLTVINPDMLENQKPKELVDRRVFVVDHYKLSSTAHEHVHHYTGDDFVSECHFYYDSVAYWKKIDVVSYMRESDLQSFDFGLVAMRYKLHSILKDELKIEGSKNGTKVSNLSMKTHHVERYVRPLESHKYQDEENIKYLSVKENEIWNKKVQETWQKWLESFRWMDTTTTKNFRMLLGSNLS